MMNRSQTRTAPMTSPPAAGYPIRTLWAIRLLLLAAIVAAFGRSVANDFVDWDDSGLIYQNPNLNPPTLRGLEHHWNPLNQDNVGMYDPLVYTVWWGLAQGAELQTPDVSGAKLNPQIFHAANLALHWLTACLVLEILLRLKIEPWPAAGGALIFAIHPLQTEAVVWATGMKDLLCGFFCMATIWVHLCGAGKIGPARRKNDLCAGALYVAALLCKPSAVILPLIMIALDLLVLGRTWKKSLAAMAPWLAVAAIFTVLASHLQPSVLIRNAPLWMRPLVAADALAFYMAKIVLPINLALDYGRSPANLLEDASLHHALWWSWIFPVLAGLLIYRFRQNRRLVAAAWIFVLGLLPVLGLTTFIFQYYSTVADRYVYLPMLGVALTAGLLFQRLSRGVAIVTALVVTVTLTGLSFAQAGVWRDSETLYLHDLAMNNQNPLHWLILGQYRDRQANMALRRAQQDIAGGDSAGASDETENAQKSVEEAIDSYREVIRLHPLAPMAYDHLSVDLIRTQRMDEAIDVIRKWIDLQPSFPPQAREDPAKLQFSLGMAYYNAHDYSHAADAFEQSLKFRDDPFVEQQLEKARDKMHSATEPAADTRP
jgi:tetratricopeptide (TPR) repeat protein